MMLIARVSERFCLMIISQQEAIEALLNPFYSTTKDLAIGLALNEKRLQDFASNNSNRKRNINVAGRVYYELKSSNEL